MTLDQFILQIPGFDAIASGKKIDLLVYYNTILCGNYQGTTVKEIDQCFELLHLQKYSNIPQYLKQKSQRTKNGMPIFLGQAGMYRLERSAKTAIDDLINAPKEVQPTNSLFPLEILKGTRGYLESVAAQAASCYDVGLYDACSVMTRKLLEILVIEAFERHQIDNKIKNSVGVFYFLSDLIDHFKAEPSWNIGRNAKESISKLKKLGDLSAHGRRYVARKGDIDKHKDDLRIVVEELVHLVDYPTWKQK